MTMMNVRRLVSACAVVAAVALGGPSTAQVQMDHKFDPFFDNMLYQSQVYGIEMVGQRLAMAGAFAAPVNSQLVPQLKRMEQRDYARFKGTLAQRNAQLEKDLAAALRSVMAKVESGQSATAEIAKARQLLDEASKVIIDQKVRDQPPFKGAVMLLRHAPGGRYWPSGI